MKRKTDIEQFIYNHRAINDDGYSMSLLAEDIADKFDIDDEDDELWDLFEEIFPERFENEE